MATLDYTFRLHKAKWDFGTGVGVQYVMCYHQYIDADGYAIEPDSPGGSWEPFIPGPVIRGNVGDTVRVTVQNRMSDPHNHFVKALKTATTIHWHGIELSNAHDGTTVTQKPLHAFDDFVYKFKLVRPGVFWYHPHWDSMIQTLLGGYGTIIVEDGNYQQLRSMKIIPHEDRNFNITLSDVSFQSDREVESSATYVPVADIPAANNSNTPVYIRNILNLPGGGAQNFGDVHLINGKYNTPLNDANGNFQQFWYKGERTTAAPITVQQGESLSFELLNSGLHRFYKVHLAFKNNVNGPWFRSDALFRIGGEGGLLDDARAGGGVFDSGLPDKYVIRGFKGRALNGGADQAGAGYSTPQTVPELTPGEFLLSESSRIILAFDIEPGCVEAAIRVNGFSVAQNTGNPAGDEMPEDMIIAHFTNIGSNPSPEYVLTSNIVDGTPLLNAVSAPLEDLSQIPDSSVVTEYDDSICDKAQLAANGVIVPDGSLMTDYAITLDGGGGPKINGVQAHWTDEGPTQPTFDNTRYVVKDDVVEWTVETNTTGADHPFHIHGFAFQPIKMELNNGSGYTTLYEWDFVEYVDSIYVPYAHRLTFRFKVDDRPYIGEDDVEYPNGVLGRWLAHCHIFKHAHQGMMMNFFVIDNCEMLTQKTDIYLRDAVSDDGTEPSTVASLNSNDIVLAKFLVGDPQLSYGHGSGTENLSPFGQYLELGQDNYIFARFSNRTSLPGSAAADLYWSPFSTLLTPNTWNYLGETNEVLVPDQTSLMVSDPLTWASGNLPQGQGWYVMIAIAGSQTDPKTLTTYDVYNYPGNFTWTEFLDDLIRANNNVVRKFISAVDLETLVPPIIYKFKFRGAFDQDRVFDMVFTNRFIKTSIDLVIPNEDQFQEALKLTGHRFTVEKNDLKIQMSPNSSLTLANLRLEKDKDYESCFVINDNREDIATLSPVASQQYVGEKGERIEVGQVSWDFLKKSSKNEGRR